MPIHRFTREALTATPWKNGGGVTREIVCQPPGAGMDAFDWRVSIAHIASDGPFSAFAGVDRIITLLEGAGVRLHSTDGASDLIARVLGPVGAHTRTSVGVLQLPKGAAVELDLIARVD